MTVAADLDLIQGRLHDDGALWTRAELLRLYNEGYGDLLSDSGAVRRWRPTDLPGRHTFGITQEWEAASAYHGTVRKPTFSMLAEAYQGTSQWEIEAIEGITPTTSLGGHTQEWERAYRSGDSDLHFRFSFPLNHERVVRLEWQNRKLHPVGVRELDSSDTRWFAQIGEPRWWTTGTGRVRSVELYEIATAYHQAYAYDAASVGVARSFSGERTWAAEAPIDTATAYAYTSSADVPTGLRGLGYRVARYAAPAAPLGTTLVTNGTFETALDGWTVGPHTGWSASHGGIVLMVIGSGTLQQDIAVTAGKVYEVQFRMYRGTATFTVGSTSGGSDLLNLTVTGTGFYTLNTTASSALLSITLAQVGTVNVEADDISVREVTAVNTVLPHPEDYHGVYPWEAEVLGGSTTTFTASGTIGAYSWERDYGATWVALAVGQPRSVSSTERQYLPVTSDATLGNLLGRIMDWRSSEDSVMALEVVIPDGDLVEADTPTLIPPQLAKYVRFYVLSRAFQRPGEGRQPVLADYYGRRYTRGVALLRAMGDVARVDRSFRRELMQPARRRPPYVRLPSTYPSVWT